MSSKKDNTLPVKKWEELTPEEQAAAYAESLANVDSLKSTNEGLILDKEGLISDIEALKEANEGLKTENDALKEANEGLTSENASFKELVDTLNAEVSKKPVDSNSLGEVEHDGKKYKIAIPRIQHSEFGIITAEDVKSDVKIIASLVEAESGMLQLIEE